MHYIPAGSTLLEVSFMAQRFGQRHSAFKAVGSWGPWASISSSVKPGGWNPFPLKDPCGWSSIVRHQALWVSVPFSVRWGDLCLTAHSLNQRMGMETLGKCPELHKCQMLSLFIQSAASWITEGRWPDPRAGQESWVPFCLASIGFWNLVFWGIHGVMELQCPLYVTRG